MPRPTGVRNPDYAQRRSALIARIEHRLVNPPDHPTMASLAKAAGVSIPTLKHYFGTRAGVVEAVLADGGGRGARFMAIAAEPDGDFAQSMLSCGRFVVDGFTHGRLGDLHAVGFAEAFRDVDASATYLDAIMDPMIDSVALRLTAHQARGEMIATDARAAALIFLGPLFLGLIHQRDFSGATHSPVNLDELHRAHVEAFSRAFNC